MAESNIEAAFSRALTIKMKTNSQVIQSFNLFSKFEFFHRNSIFQTNKHSKILTAKLILPYKMNKFKQSFLLFVDFSSTLLEKNFLLYYFIFQQFIIMLIRKIYEQKMQKKQQTFDKIKLIQDANPSHNNMNGSKSEQQQPLVDTGEGAGEESETGAIEQKETKIDLADETVENDGQKATVKRRNCIVKALMEHRILLIIIAAILTLLLFNLILWATIPFDCTTNSPQFGTEAREIKVSNKINCLTNTFV